MKIDAGKRKRKLVNNKKKEIKEKFKNLKIH